MIAITPAINTGSVVDVNSSDLSYYKNFLLPGIATRRHSWATNSYILEQTISLGAITASKYVVHMRQAEVMHGLVTEPRFMLNWMQHGSISECYLNHHGKIKLKEGYLSLLYLPANNTQICTLEAGDYAFSQIYFSAQELHTYHATAPYIAHFLNLYHQSSIMPFPGRQIQCTGKILKSVAEVFTNRDIEYDLDGLIYYYCYSCRFIPEIHSKTIGRMQDIIHYILSNPNDKCNLPAIATHMQLSASHIKNIVKTATNQNPGEFIAEMQIQRARTLLLNNREMRIREVADEIGYTLPYFSRRFKQRFSVTPVEFQNSVHSNRTLLTG